MQLPFFPPSLPDETIQSRIARYHILSGNRTERLTYVELFGVAPIELAGTTPHAITELARRLPGNTLGNLDQLLTHNTLLPLFAPFMGRNPVVKPGDPALSAMLRNPRRVNADHGNAKLCLGCVRDDVIEQGTPYWHREHQIPGVEVCRRHLQPLLHVCPICKRPFQRRMKILVQPWQACACGWSASKAPVGDSLASDHPSVRYTHFGAALLQAEIAPTPAERLRDTYLSAMKRHGLQSGRGRAGLTGLRSALEAEYGAEFITRIDANYVTAQTGSWLRLVVRDQLMDMPLPRHILLIMFLFGSVDRFKSDLQQFDQDRQTKRRTASPCTMAINVAKQDQHRQVVLRLQSAGVAITMEMLWKRAYRAAEWLYEHDRVWLDCLLGTSLAGRSCAPAADDAALCKALGPIIDGFYAESGRPERVTKARMAKAVADGRGIYFDQTRYPQLYALMERKRESWWHYLVRRLLYGLVEFQRREGMSTPPAPHHILRANTATVREVIDHFQWDLAAMIRTPVNPVAELLRTGISCHWAGPQQAGISKPAGQQSMRFGELAGVYQQLSGAS